MYQRLRQKQVLQLRPSTVDAKRLNKHVDTKCSQVILVILKHSTKAADMTRCLNVPQKRVCVPEVTTKPLFVEGKIHSKNRP